MDATRSLRAWRFASSWVSMTPTPRCGVNSRIGWEHGSVNDTAVSVTSPTDCSLKNPSGATASQDCRCRSVRTIATTSPMTYASALDHVCLRSWRAPTTEYTCSLPPKISRAALATRKRYESCSWRGLPTTRTAFVAGSKKQRKKPTKAVSTRRRIGDAAEQARFRDGVRVRAARFKNKKREAARRACRGTRRNAD